MCFHTTKIQRIFEIKKGVGGFYLVSGIIHIFQQTNNDKR